MRLRLAARDGPGELAAELALDEVPEATRDRALRDTVLLLSSALLRRSCMMDVSLGVGYKNEVLDRK